MENEYISVYVYRRRFFDHSHLVDGRPRGTGSSHRHDRESVRVPRPVYRPQSVQQPVAAEPVRGRQHGVHNQRTVDCALLGVARVVLVCHR